MILAPGVYPGMPFDEYLSYDENVSKHLLDSLSRSPQHYLAALAAPRKQTPGMAQGKAAHTAILEWPEFDKRYALAPDTDKRSRAGKDAWAAAASNGLELLKREDYDAVLAMRNAVITHPFAGILLAPEDGEAEVSIAWVEMGVPCRARPDFLNQPHGLCVDLKTCQDASLGGFTRAVVNYGYHIQASFYLSGLAAVKQPHDKFIFVAVEQEKPYAIGCYELSPDDTELGRTLYKRALRVYQECTETGVWPGFPPHVRTITLPAYARILPIS